jgi:hypothetical protein
MNEDNKIKRGLEEIIRRTFEVIDNVYSVNKDKKNYNSRLIFPNLFLLTNLFAQVIILFLEH